MNSARRGSFFWEREKNRIKKTNIFFLRETKTVYLLDSFPSYLYKWNNPAQSTCLLPSGLCSVPTLHFTVLSFNQEQDTAVGQREINCLLQERVAWALQAGNCGLVTLATVHQSQLLPWLWAAQNAGHCSALIWITRVTFDLLGRRQPCVARSWTPFQSSNAALSWGVF